MTQAVHSHGVQPQRASFFLTQWEISKECFYDGFYYLKDRIWSPTPIEQKARAFAENPTLETEKDKNALKDCFLSKEYSKCAHFIKKGLKQICDRNEWENLHETFERLFETYIEQDKDPLELIQRLQYLARLEQIEIVRNVIINRK